MDLGTIDYWGISGTSPLHKASPLAKLLAAGLIITAVIVTEDIFALLAIYIAVAAGIVLSRLPVLQVLAIGAYPAVFALLFAVSRWNGSFLEPMVIILKALAAAATMVALITTTPYPELFGVLRHLLPALIADALFLTYRSLFILLGLMGNLLTALRLRGGLSRRRYIQNLRNLASGLGLLLIRAIALSERVYDVMRLRGYSGRLATGAAWRRTTPYDLLPLGAGFLILGSVLALSFAPGGYQYNGYLLVAALVSLLAAFLTRHTARRPTTG